VTDKDGASRKDEREEKTAYIQTDIEKRMGRKTEKTKNRRGEEGREKCLAPEGAGGGGDPQVSLVLVEAELVQDAAPHCARARTRDCACVCFLCVRARAVDLCVVQSWVVRLGCVCVLARALGIPVMRAFDAVLVCVD
jgi:hypothetical protein